MERMPWPAPDTASVPYSPYHQELDSALRRLSGLRIRKTRRCAAALLALALILPLCGGDRRHSYAVSVATLGGCAVADAWTTQRVLSQGGNEMNPMIRGNNPWAVKIAITGGLVGIQWLLRKKIPAHAWTPMNLAGSAAWCGAAGYNTTQLRKKGPR